MGETILDRLVFVHNTGQRHVHKVYFNKRTLIIQCICMRFIQPDWNRTTTTMMYKYCYIDYIIKSVYSSRNSYNNILTVERPFYGHADVIRNVVGIQMFTGYVTTNGDVYNWYGDKIHDTTPAKHTYIERCAVFETMHETYLNSAF